MGINTSANLLSGNVSLAVDGIIFFVVFFAGLLVSWWALGALKWEKVVFFPLSPQATMLRFLLALVGATLWGLIALLYLLAVQMIRML